MTPRVGAANTSNCRDTAARVPRGTTVLFPLLFVLLLIASLGVYGQELGQIVYLEGDVQLARDGEVRDGFQINIGEPVLEMDVIQTGYDGFVEIELTQPQRSTVRIQENSAYYVELLEGENGATTTRLKVPHRFVRDRR
jgi:hypothetical protein